MSSHRLAPSPVVFMATVLILLSGAARSEVVLSQDFQSSTSVAHYENLTSPTLGQFNDIGQEVNSGTWSITQGRLQISRTGASLPDNGAGFTRSTDFAGPPSVLHVSFQLGVNANANPVQNDALVIDIGDIPGITDYNQSIPDKATFSRLNIDLEGGDTFTFEINGVDSPRLPADGTSFSVSYLLNGSGGTRSYVAPDGSTRGLSHGHVALWVGTTVLFDNVPRTHGHSALTDLRVRLAQSDVGTWHFDNIQVSNELPNATQAVTHFTLINADTDEPIPGFDPLPDGATLDLTALPTRNLNVRANTSPATVGSVRFALDGQSNFRTESGAPYALAGDRSGDYHAWTPGLGAHTLKATPFSGSSASGTAGTALTVHFRVVEGAGGTVVARLNAGGPAVTTSGIQWDADRDFSSNSMSYSDSSISIAKTADDVLYQSHRSASSNLGSFHYGIPVPASGTYTVRLHFAEIYWGAPGGQAGGFGKRVFDVNVEGDALELDDHDLTADVSFATASVKTFSVFVSDGTLDLQFSASVNRPLISAIEVIQNTAPLVSVAPLRSLAVTEPAILDGRFSFQRLMEHLVAQSGVPGLTSLELFQQWWDTQNPAPGLGLGAHCSDEGETLNGFHYDCRPAEGAQASVNPFTGDASSNPNFYKPIGLFNRFDLAPIDGSHCGEYRLIYAREGAGNDVHADGSGFRKRNLVIFEGVLPNPWPGSGLAGCRPVAEFWADLSGISDVALRAAELERFYFVGLPGFPPAAHVTHYGTSFDSSGNARPTGQVRTNQFMQSPWLLGEFQLVNDCRSGTCSLKMVPATVKPNPFGPLFGPNGVPAHARTTDFQDFFSSTQVATLSVRDINNIGFFLEGLEPQFERFNAAQSPNAPDTENDYAHHFQAAPSSFRSALSGEIPSGSSLTPEHIVLRAQALSCAGCHQLNNDADLGGGLTWPFSNNFVHVSELEQELESGPDGLRFNTSPALEGVFLPHRKKVLEDFLNGTPSDTQATFSATAASPDSSAQKKKPGKQRVPTLGGSTTH